MENKVKLIVISMVLLATTSCFSKDSTDGDCNMDVSLSKFLQSDSNWEVVRGPGAFFPILSLKVFESKLWVSTYGSDFFPATVKSGVNLFLIENIQFRRLPPVKIQNDPAELIKAYKSEGVVFKIPLSPNSCEIKDELQMEIILPASKNKETMSFIRSES